MSSHAERRLSVLVVEDDESIRDLLRISLEDEGYEVTAFERPPEVEAYLLQEAGDSPDIILHDLGLWNYDGVNLMQRFKERHPNAILIALTATPGNLHLSCDGVIKKPFDLNGLLDSMKYLVRLRLHDPGFE